MHLCGLIFLPHPLGSVSTRLVTGLEEMEDGWDKKRGRSAIHCGQLRGGHDRFFRQGRQTSWEGVEGLLLLAKEARQN